MNGKYDRIKIIEQAERFVRAGKIREAIIEYEKLLEEDPTDVSINNIVGDLYVRLGQTERAIRAFEKVAAEYEKKTQFSQALAILKKICRLNPDNPTYFIRLADLYTRQGFAAEAKKEYLRVAEIFLRAKRVEEAIELYEKVVRLDCDDLNLRMQLAALYKLDGQPERAVNELLEAAELKLNDNRLDEAHKILVEAKKLNPDNPRVSLKLAQVLRLKGQADEAMELARGALEKNPHDLEGLTFLGDVYFEEGKFEAAKEVFYEMLNYYPLNVNARYKLGRINLGEGDVDKAFEYFEPLIDSYLKKKKEDKAIGLIGLILTVRKDHLPSMEKLAAIFREAKDLRRLEQVDRAILAELSRIGEKARMLSYYSELLKLKPGDEKLAKEYRELKKELLLTDEEEVTQDTWIPSREQEEEIQAGLAQADVYIQEGLIRLARRVIEGLAMKYPGDPLIKQKLNYIENLKTQLSESELIKKVEKATVIETQVLRLAKGRTQDREARKSELQFEEEVLGEEKVNPLDIFRDTGIVPIISSDGREKKYYDLYENVRAELAIISAVYLRQKKGVTTQFEKELGSIVNDFKKGIRDKIPEEDHQIHMQLGLAFMEQGLLDEAIEEFNLASRDKNLLLECLNLISNCHRLKGNMEEAERWLNRAIKLVAPGSDQYFALMYDLGLIFEQAGDLERALSAYREIQSWNPTYRGISDKIEKLANMGGTPSNPLN
ncbi:MAG: tetratricopeptide repeat protein [Candidatus Saccharicenans sp.]|uniref:tetratricopeptide repeat protein n=1 Tax=Candidatus Saccharicenans sp. TaxID=2819258 RepID=UPI00404A1431